MSVADKVLQALRDSPTGMTDAELASTLGKCHPQINQTCRGLARRGLINRDGLRGHLVNRISDVVLPMRPAPIQPSSRSSEWSWEGNVQSRVATHLAATGWSIVRVADTAGREQGVDIVAERDEQRLLAEVKGWPSTTYAHGERVGQPKPTRPSTQAAIWLSGG
jgi:hypothetical protein